MVETKDVASALTERLGQQGTFFKDSDTGQVLTSAFWFDKSLLYLFATICYVII